MDWLYILMALIFILTQMAGFLIAKSIFKPIRRSLLETRLMENEKNPGLMEEYDTWAKSEYKIHSRFGYDLQAYYIKPIELTNRFVILAHGYTYTHHGCVKYAKMMRDLGFNVVLYDERYHGESGGKNCTLGFYEKDDLYDVISDTFERYGENLFLGTYGESMGAATVLLEQAFDKRIKFVVSDCAFSDLEDLIKYLIKRKVKYANRLLLCVSNFYFKLFTKATFKKVCPKSSLSQASVPILFVHGKEDEFIPPVHSQILYEICPSPKAIYIGENRAKHAETASKNPKEYQKILENFLFEYVLNSKD
ncbi:MAG: alpha/beta hydrolase [Firmicutes bacterium]|nr:alpha/beta hydrolase [Bacillota bacterium]